MADAAMQGQGADLRWGSFVLLGLLAIVFGLLIAMFPGISTTVLIELIGIFIIILSFGVIMMSAVAPGGLKGSVLLAILGVIGFFFGIATILFTVRDGQGDLLPGRYRPVHRGYHRDSPGHFGKTDDPPGPLCTPGHFSR